MKKFIVLLLCLALLSTTGIAAFAEGTEDSGDPVPVEETPIPDPAGNDTSDPGDPVSDTEPASDEAPTSTEPPAPVSAPAGQARAVIGIDLTADQISSVYNMFGITRGTVTELTVTNAEEREYLAGLVDNSVIGTRAISCAYLEILPEGQGLQISTQNLTWCTQDMFANALVTSGVYDAKIVVAAPFAVSGTAALTGIYKAYEDITGQKLSQEAKEVGTQELVITGELADEIGSYDAVTIVNELKLVLDETRNMNDDELKQQIIIIANEYNVTLNDSQISQLITLCRQLERMNSDELRSKVESVQDTIRKLADAKEKVSGFTATVQNVVQSVQSFFQKIVSFFTKK